MRPIVTCEKPSFHRLIQGLTGITDSTLFPNHKNISKLLQLKYENYVSMLTSLIEKQNHICCTADIWSANNKSFMGTTCHFIDEFSHKRSSYVLSCRRIKGSHNYLNIYDVITDICDTYKIRTSKITHIITDNASNFGKAFCTFSKSSTIEYDPHYVGNLDELESDEDTSVDSDNKNNLPSPIDIEYTDVGQLLYESNGSDSTNFSLPNHLTCVAHSLNLIATIDVAKITNKNYVNISKQAFSKLSSFWNLLSKSIGASDKVFDICKVKFPVPIMTRWNSMFDAIQKVLLFKEKLTFVFVELKLAKLKNSEWVFWKSTVK
ncbi:Dimer Tnp hAT domain-containing protein [Aphis craccivora]|uniref:Dimer Tnp hAT domain-containing protein n=1 Tax=Aphis craccivora TaxID=307492 RepID=A0A6G0YBD0_APHCR|nr:Dimer Tnp hAT domain-containing protein [Aphis craccivora]